MILDDYLKELQNREESLFPMDSPHTGQGPFRYKKRAKDLDDDSDLEHEDKE
jgi:hypothetical protein